MKNYEVMIPVTGYIYVDVEAENEDEAVDMAMQSDDISLDNIAEWEVHRHVIQGNVCYALLNSVEVEEV